MNLSGIKSPLILNGFSFALLIAVCATVMSGHIQIMKERYPGDLRNRVVGARLLKSKISPYYYKWKPSDPETWYDPLERCNTRQSMITAPPGVLLLMSPLAALHYTEIAMIWVVIHYLFFLLIFISYWRYFKAPVSKIMVLLAAIALLFSAPWEQSVLTGQIHFILAGIVALLLPVSQLTNSRKYLWIGILLALAVWLRPNALLLLPFVLAGKFPGRSHIARALIAMAMMLAILSLAAGQLPYWIDFYHSCRDWMNYFSNPLPMVPPCFQLTSFEGIRIPTDGSRLVLITNEANLLPLLARTTGLTIPAGIAMLACAIAWLVLLFIWRLQKKVSFEESLFAGLFGYWMFEVVSQIPKTTYYMLELFPVIFFLTGRIPTSLVIRIILPVVILLMFTHQVTENLLLSEYLLMGLLAWHLLIDPMLKKKGPETGAL